MELPCAVDRPVAEDAEAGEAEGTGVEGVAEVVLDCGCGGRC